MFVVGVLFVVFAMKLSFGERLNRSVLTALRAGNTLASSAATLPRRVRCR